MGKRELLIIVAFIAIGAIAFELSAPPAPEGRGFSFARFFQNARRNIRGNAAVASTTLTGDLPIAATVTEVRLAGANRGVHVVGEERASIAYELHIESNGPDDATALEAAKRASLKQDDLGTSLALTVTYPKEGQQWGALVLRVPARLAVRVSGNGGADVSGVKSVDLDQVSGSTSIRNISGAVTGSHRNGDLTLEKIGAADLNLASSRAKVSGVEHNLMLSSRNGRVEISATQGLVEIDETNQEITVHEPAGGVRVTGTSGRVTIENPRQEIKVDCRRAEVELTLSQSVPATLLTTDEPIRLTLAGTPQIALDAAASDGGAIHAEDFDLEVKSAEGEQHVTHNFGASPTARVTLRSARGDIVIRKAK
jgi:hypothetical protein